MGGCRFESDVDTEAWRRESEEPERNRETHRGQEELEEDGGRAESAKTDKKTRRDYASNLNICC